MQIIAPLFERLGRWFACFIATSRLLVLCRWTARRLGESLKKLGRQLVNFGEKEFSQKWGAVLFERLSFAEL
jgi:hypothetical protein